VRVTAAIVADLLAGPGRDVILNVAAGNEVARRIYERLGFRVHCSYWEGVVARRTNEQLLPLSVHGEGPG